MRAHDRLDGVATTAISPAGLEGTDRRAARDPARDAPTPPWVAPLLLVVTLCSLVAGAALHLAGDGAAGNVAWGVGGAVGAAYTLWTMLDGIRRHRLGVDVIALLALVGALAVEEYLAAAVIAVMVASGRALEGWAAGRARRELQALLEGAPRTARRYDGATLVQVDVDAVVAGDRLLVASGELVPTDGVLLADAVLDESALTGESHPVERSSGDPVRSGVTNSGGPFDLLASAPAAESTYEGIVRLVAQAEATPAPFVRLADRYALWFVGVALVVSGLAWAIGGAERAVAVLVVATPCPLILAAPVALVAGLSRAARRGIVVKGGGVLERLATCTTLLIDKTGTLTAGRPELTAVLAGETVAPDELLALAGSLDQASPHVLAIAVVRAASARDLDLSLPETVHEVAGRGIEGRVDGREVRLGNESWVGVTGAAPWARTARRRARLDGSMTVFVSVDGRPSGALLFGDPIRPDAARTIQSLRQSGIQRIVMVSGDRAEVAGSIGAVLGVDDVLAERAPEEKLDAVREERRRAPTIMVGDGVNDAPALAIADVGVAMGARGATASSQAADVVLTVDRLDRVGDARSIARRSRAIALESVVAGMAMSFVAMGFAAVGLLPAVFGALLQEAIDVAVILNALRALRPGPVDTRLTDADLALTRRFRAEHAAIRADIDQVLAVAECLGTAPPREALARLREVHRVLVEEVQPHEEAEQATLYPALERVVGGVDPTGPMRRAHVEIAHQVRRFGQLLDEIGPEGPGDEDVAELRALLYGLHAVLLLHTQQEEESYLSLGDDEVARAR